MRAGADVESPLTFLPYVQLRVLYSQKGCSVSRAEPGLTKCECLSSSRQYKEPSEFIAGH